MKITMVYDNGLGTSLMMGMSIKNTLKDLSISADIGHVDLGSTKETPNDICVGTKDIVEQLVAQSAVDETVALENMISKKAMREHLFMVLTELGAL